MVQQNIVWPLRPTLPVLALDSTSPATVAFMMEVIAIIVNETATK